MVKELRHYSDGSGIDSRWSHWIFQWHTYSFRPYHSPGVDSAHNENEYKENFLGVKVAGAWGWQTYHFHVPNVMKSGSLNLLEPPGPLLYLLFTSTLIYLKHVPRVHSVATLLYLQFVVHSMLFRMLNALYFYIFTSRSICAVPNMNVFCNSLICWSPGIFFRYFLNYFRWFQLPLLLVLSPLLLHSTCAVFLL